MLWGGKKQLRRENDRLEEENEILASRNKHLEFRVNHLTEYSKLLERKLIELRRPKDIRPYSEEEIRQLDRLKEKIGNETIVEGDGGV